MRNKFSVLMLSCCMLLTSSHFIASSSSASDGETKCASLRGVNLSGAEFGQKLPGTYAKDYIYPSERTIAYFAANGATAIRLPFLWPRLQRSLNAPLDPEELDRLKHTVKTISDLGLSVVLDPHDHARYKGAKIGTSHVSFAHFADFWVKLASQFKDNDKVIFSLTNEPFDMSARIWLRAANAAIAAIRQTGAEQLILVPGIHFTGAHSWFADWQGGNNSRVMKGVIDPLDNYGYDLHQYLDHDFSGRNTECTKAAEALQGIKRVSNWLEQQGKKGFLGEFGSSSEPQCIAAMLEMTQYINDTQEQWLGWTYWAAGDWWPQDYFLSVQPQNEEEILPQWQALKDQC